MGTTLEHGVYLPDEGERNCYAGLKVNWETLDQKVADISALQSAIAGALHREIVATLPTTDIDPNTIYMILSGTSATENVYNEFMYVNNAWELIGTSATDLTNYYTKSEVDGKLLLKANASDLNSHTGDTTIHVTASDKAKWNTVALIKQLRLVNAQVGSSTTIAFANIDDTNGIKVGDKCMDLDGKMFEITAVDTTNQTVTVGSALIDIALDPNVVHNSGEESVIGSKRFGVVQSFTGYPSIRLYSLTDDINVLPSAVEQRDIRFTDKNNVPIAYLLFQHRNDASEPFRTCWRQSRLDGTNNYYSVDFNNLGEFYPENNNTINLGRSSNKWKDVNTYLVNGLTPSSLSFPADSYIDISGYVTDLTGGNNQYLAPENGWVFVDSNTTISSVIINNSKGYSTGFIFTGQLGRQRNTLPVCKGDLILINVNCASLNAVRFIPCQGNV